MERRVVSVWLPFLASECARPLPSPGTELSTAKKISVHAYQQHSMFILTSGLRSIRDKAKKEHPHLAEQIDAMTDKRIAAIKGSRGANSNK